MRKIENENLEKTSGGWLPTGLDGQFWLTQDEINTLERSQMIVENLDHLIEERPENKSYCLVWMRDYSEPRERREYVKHFVNSDEMAALLGVAEPLPENWNF